MPEPATSSEAEPEREKSPLAKMVERLDARLQSSGRMVEKMEPMQPGTMEAFFIPTVARMPKQPESEPSES